MGFCKLAYPTILTLIGYLLVYFSCIISIVFAYYKLSVNDVTTASLYVIAIPFYVYIVGYILQPIMTCYEDHKSNSIGIEDLLCSTYFFKMVFTILKKAFYSGLFFVTLYLLADYNENNIEQNYKVSRYIYALSIYVLLTWCRDWFGSFVEWLYYNGSLFYGNNIDADNDKKDVKKAKLFRVYLFERSSNGLTMSRNKTEINYTTLLDPIRPCFGIALFLISESLIKNSSAMLVQDVTYAAYIVQVGVLASLCINTLLMMIMMCVFNDLFSNMKLYMFGLYLRMICNNLSYVLCSYFYKGMSEHLHDKSLDPIFVYYIIGIIAYHTVLCCVFKVSTLYGIYKASKMTRGIIA